MNNSNILIVIVILWNVELISHCLCINSCFPLAGGILCQSMLKPSYLLV